MDQAYSNSRFRRSILIGILFLFLIGSGLAGCLSPRTPDVSSILFLSGPEKIPLRVGVQLDRLEGATEQLGTRYSKYGGGRGKVPVAIGDPLGEALLEGFGRTFLDARQGAESTSDFVPDLLIRPSYRILSNTSGGQYSGVEAVISLEISDQLGKTGQIDTETIGVRSDGPFRSWKGYVAILVPLAGLGWLDADRWAQVTARLGKHAVQELDTRLRTDPIVLETVRRKQARVPLELDGSSSTDLGPAFQRFIESLVAVPHEVPGNVVIGPLMTPQGSSTQWDAFVEEMLWRNFSGSLRGKLVPRTKATQTLTQLNSMGVDWSVRASVMQYSADVGAYWAIMASTCHVGETLVIHGNLISRVSGDIVRTNSMQIVKSWRPTVVHASTVESRCLEN